MLCHSTVISFEAHITVESLLHLFDIKRALVSFKQSHGNTPYFEGHVLVLTPFQETITTDVFLETSEKILHVPGQSANRLSTDSRMFLQCELGEIHSIFHITRYNGNRKRFFIKPFAQLSKENTSTWLAFACKSV